MEVEPFCRIRYPKLRKESKRVQREVPQGSINTKFRTIQNEDGKVRLFFYTI